MTTLMVAPINIGLQFRGNWCNAKKKIVDKAGEFLKPSFNSSCNTNALNYKPRFSLLMAACSHCSPEGMDTTNEMANESTEHRALVTFFRGRFVEDKLVYMQVFLVKSYEIGPDQTITIETLMSFLQVQVQRYSKRYQHLPLIKGDEIEVETWFDSAGKNGVRKDWIIRDHCTKEIIAKATRWAIMNRETRKLSRIPEEVRQELVPFYFNRLAIATEEIDHQKIHKLTDATAESFPYGMAPGWNDTDANQHVNNVKYIRWILESMPREVLEDYKMTSMTLEFRRECTQSDMLE